VADRALGIAEAIVEARQIVVRICAFGRARERSFVRGTRLIEAIEVLERHAEVECRRRIVRPRRERRAVVLLGFMRPARLVRETAEVHVAVGMAGIEGERPPIGESGLFRVALFEFGAERVPAIGRCGQRCSS
jgi:hypothetical protein